jgi:hypothetical protein
MLAWTPSSEDKNVGKDDRSNPQKESRSAASDLLYRLTMAFPSLAGAIVAVYSISLCRFSALKIRLK